VKSGGQVMVLGINDKEVLINPFMLVLWEVEMKGVLGYYDEFKYVIDFLEQKRLQTGPLVSETILLQDLEEKGFKKLLSSRDVVKVLVRPS
jgi:(R,R)-butanediol dehydrogenase/meso-butanediol dehydrogenase/diacetyl reductase